jgi:hypothetical protein
VALVVVVASPVVFFSFSFLLVGGDGAKLASLAERRPL